MTYSMMKVVWNPISGVSGRLQGGGQENNYHLPHHLYKKLQLEQFRPVAAKKHLPCVAIPLDRNA